MLSKLNTLYWDAFLNCTGHIIIEALQNEEISLVHVKHIVEKETTKVHESVIHSVDGEDTYGSHGKERKARRKTVWTDRQGGKDHLLKLQGNEFNANKDELLEMDPASHSLGRT